MRRWFSIAASYLILLMLPVWAQHSGGGHAGGGHAASGGFSSHSAGSFHGGSVGHSYSGFSGINSAHSFSRSSSTRVRIEGRGGDRRGFYRRRGYYPYGLYYPYYPYYGWYDQNYDTGYQDDNEENSAYANAGQYSAAPYRDDGLRSDVQALNGKIDRLQ